MEGWVKISRKLAYWEWHDDPVMMSVWIHLLLLANHSDTEWHGQVIERGQIVTGRKKLADFVGVTEQTIRTCINRLKGTGEITQISTNRFSIITICNYDKYQLSEEISKPTTNQQLTSSQPAANQQLTTNKNDKKEKKEKKERNDDDNARTHAREDFSPIERTDTSLCELVCIERGWDKDDYAAAVKVFVATCAFEGKEHDSEADLTRHFRFWCGRKYGYGEHPDRSNGGGDASGPAKGGAQKDERLGVGEWIDKDGKRRYSNGMPPVPMDAKPRPDNQSYFSAETKTWIPFGI